MIETFLNDQVCIVDDLLEPDQFEELFSYIARAEFRQVHRTAWQKVWRLSDGLPLSGGTYLSDEEASNHTSTSLPRFPGGTPLDAFVSAVHSVADQREELVGKKDLDWATFTLSPWIYPVGTGLSLHQDGRAYSGAYTYFLHRKWNVHWGGLLLALAPDTPLPRAEDTGRTWLDDEEERERTFTPGTALCILPKPNRLVLIAPDAQHLVTKVDPAAGQNARLSIAGFFRRQTVHQ